MDPRCPAVVDVGLQPWFAVNPFVDWVLGTISNPTEHDGKRNFTTRFGCKVDKWVNSYHPNEFFRMILLAAKTGSVGVLG